VQSWYLPFGRGFQWGIPDPGSAIETVLGSFFYRRLWRISAKLPVGAVFAYDAQGSVAFQAQFDFLAGGESHCDAGIARVSGPSAWTAGPSVTIGGGFTLSGEIETRIWKKSADVVQIGYYKKQGSSFTVSFDASAGVDVTVEGYDIVAKLYGSAGRLGTTRQRLVERSRAGRVADDVADGLSVSGPDQTFDRHR